MIRSLLERPSARGTKVPRYRVENAEDRIAGRWKRVRRWDQSEAAVILPWIGLNASGSDLCGEIELHDDSKTGQNMCKLAYHWGFGGVSAYNLIPLLGSKSDRVVAQAEQCRQANATAWDRKVGRNYELVAADLRDVDAVIVGWGTKGSRLFVRTLATELFMMLPKHSTFAFAPNGGRRQTPRHAALRGFFDFEKCTATPFPRTLFTVS